MVHVTLKRVTQKDIAQAANLSIAAVSMALRGNSALPPATIKRVRAIADELGYVPDPALSALAAYRNTVRARRSFAALAFVQLQSEDSPRQAPSSLRTLVEAAETRAQQLGFTLQQFTTQPGEMTPSRLNGILRARGIQGIVIAPGCDLEDGEGIAWEEFNIVTTQTVGPRSGFHSVASDPQFDLLTCWQRLMAQGHRRIGLVVDEQNDRETKEAWEAAHFIGQRRHDIKAKEALPNLYLGAKGCARAASRWIIKHKPDAIISTKAGLAEDLRQSGFKLPQDLAYVSLNVEDDSIGASGIMRQSEKIGAVAVDTLSSLVQQNRASARNVTTAIRVDSEWCDGDTL